MLRFNHPRQFGLQQDPRKLKLPRRLAPPLRFFVCLSVSFLILSSNNIPGRFNLKRSLFTPYNTTQSVLLPSWTNNLVDVWDTSPPATATPLFWYIPKGGGSTINKILTYCLNFTVASDRGRYLNQSVSYGLRHHVCRFPSCLQCGPSLPFPSVILTAYEFLRHPLADTIWEVA